MAVAVPHRIRRDVLRINDQFRRDPSRTLTLRRNMIRDFDRRWNALKRVMRESIVAQDCFGIQPDVVGIAPTGLRANVSATPAKAFQFATDLGKLDGFMGWLRAQEQLGVLEVVSRPGGILEGGLLAEQPWTNVYVDSAYQQGMRRGRAELIRNGHAVPTFESVPGGVGAAMNQPIHADRLAVLYQRTFDDLAHVVDAANAQIRREITQGITTDLTRGLAEGKNPRTIAREMYNNAANRLDKVGRARSRTIARTEIIRAHHEASITEYELVDAEMDVTIEAEWGLGPNPCPVCEELEAGAPYKLQEARGLIPAHPNCVCVVLPSVVRR